MLAREVVDVDRVAEGDDGVAVSLETMKQAAEEALEEIVEGGLELLPFGGSFLPAQELLGEVAVLEHPVVVHGGGDDEQRRAEFRIALGGDDVVEHPQLRLLE